MMLKDAFQLPPLLALGVKSAPGATVYSRSEGHLGIDTGFYRADRRPLRPRADTLRPAHGLLRPTQSPSGQHRVSQASARLCFGSNEGLLRLLEDHRLLVTCIYKGLYQADKRRSQATHDHLSPIAAPPPSPGSTLEVFRIQLVQYLI